MASSSLSSFLIPDRSQHDLQQNVIREQQQVEVRCLDTVYHDLLLKHDVERFYLKMDTQGYDLRVCMGGAEFLARVAALQSEMSVVPIYEGMPGYVRAIEYFNQLGYELSGMFPVKVDSELRLVEFDCVMVRKEKFA